MYVSFCLGVCNIVFIFRAVATGTPTYLGERGSNLAHGFFLIVSVAIVAKQSTLHPWNGPSDRCLDAAWRV